MDTKKQKKKHGLPNRRVVELKNDSKMYGKVSHVSIFDTITPTIIGPSPYYNKTPCAEITQSKLRMVESAIPLPIPIPIPIPILLPIPPLIPIPPPIPRLHCGLTILAVTYITVYERDERECEKALDSVCKKQKLCEDLTLMNGSCVFPLDSYQKEFTRCKL